MERIIDMISSPHDLKALNNEELEIVSQEIRDEIVNTTANNGGHIGSSLGAVETIVALHAELNCPTDRIVFDVGHQAYAHKILTGRLDRFATLRQYGGISGFPNPDESEYDVHYSGHASDSLSVALGLARARDLRGTNENIVALIGDAGISGGMAFEALNQIGQDQTRLLIILNDNAMAISHNVGALMKHLGALRASNDYRDTRDSMQVAMENAGPAGRMALDFARNAKDSAKHFFLSDQSMIFEQLGITCTAPIDGHDMRSLRETIRVLLRTNGPTLMHVVTKKGHGYAPAEENPEGFHGPSGFDVETGKIKASSSSRPKYMNVFGDALVKEGAANQDIVAITAAMKDGTGLGPFSRAFPERFIDTGIAEEHAVGLASGLALGGKRPIVAIYSTFLQRAIDQIIVDVALARANVVFCIDRAGVVGDDGATHNGAFDLVYMRMIPHMRVLVPSNEAELVNALHTAISGNGPFAIRYPRGEAEGVAIPEVPKLLSEGESRTVREGNDVAVLAFGPMVGESLKAADLLAQEDISVRVVDMRWAKPLDEAAIKAAAESKLVVTAEEGVLAGGVGEEILAMLAREGSSVPTLSIGLPDAFVPHGKKPLLLEKLGIDAEGIARRILDALGALA
ncbi:MAG: 1-deoxy-D-xylulose-5-phosphate synthase [Eggerthellaceae bacterium]|jgi:1-deoxy-D-xylulose-5-phosphate synthase